MLQVLIQPFLSGTGDWSTQILNDVLSGYLLFIELYFNKIMHCSVYVLIALFLSGCLNLNVSFVGMLNVYETLPFAG